MSDTRYDFPVLEYGCEVKVGADDEWIQWYGWFHEFSRAKAILDWHNDPVEKSPWIAMRIIKKTTLTQVWVE